MLADPEAEDAGIADAVQEAVARICTGFDDEYWLQRDHDGVFPTDFHQALARDGWLGRAKDSAARIAALAKDAEKTAALLKQAEVAPQGFAEQRGKLLDTLVAAEQRKQAASDAMAVAETEASEADRASRAAETAASQAREARAGLSARADAAAEKLIEAETTLRETAQMSPDELGQKLVDDAIARPPDTAGAESLLSGLEREREALGAVNLRAEQDAAEAQAEQDQLAREKADLDEAVKKLRAGCGLPAARRWARHWRSGW